jgi:hypothetical protein
METVLYVMILVSYTLAVLAARDAYYDVAPIVKRWWARRTHKPQSRTYLSPQAYAEQELWDRALHYAKKRADEFKRRGKIVASRDIFVLAMRTQERMRNMYAHG